MARQYKGYDADSEKLRREADRRVRGTGRVKGLDELTSPADPSVREVRYDDSGNLVPKFYSPKSLGDYAGFVTETYDVDDDGNSLTRLTDFDAVSPDTARPAPLTDIPTSTTNFKKPYTIAAGWERYPRQSVAYANSLGTLTLMFRDGTLYNYYDVPHSVWIGFRSSISKGTFVNRHAPDPKLNKYRRGPADVSLVSSPVRDSIYARARQAQYQYARPDGTVGTTARKKTGYNLKNPAYKYGTNNATANRPKKG